MSTAALLGLLLTTGVRQVEPPVTRQSEEALETTGDAYMAPRPFARSSGMVVKMGGFTSVQVNVDSLGRNIVGDAANEPSIAVDPTNPNNIVVGWRQFDNAASNFRQAGYGYSHTAGASWTFPGSLDAGLFRSDPVLDFDAAGNIYYNSLTIDDGGNGDNWHCDTFVTGDGGVNWSSPFFSYGGDKAWFTIDKTGGPGHGSLYEAWSTAGNNYYPNQFSRSRDGGLNWMSPIQIPPVRQVWGTLAVAANGDLYISGQSNGSIYVSKSSNAKSGGTPSFDFTNNVPLGGSFVLGGNPNPGGLMGQVWIAADKSAGPTAGNVYLLCSMDPPGSDPLDVYFARSEDGGQTWSAPVRVNDDTQGANHWQWFATMSVAPNGRIDAVWNDTRNSLVGNLSQTFTSYSLDGGRTWSKNVAMTPAWDSTVGWPNQNKIGDYYGMVSDDLGSGLAYSATFNGEQDVYYLRITPEAPVLPLSYSLFRGNLVSGGLAGLFSSDDSYLVVHPGLVPSAQDAPVQLIIEGVVGMAAPTELGFLLESHVDTPDVTERIELLNYVTGLWETVGTRAATMADTIAHVHVTANPARFINPASLHVKAKVSYKPSGLVSHYPWTVSFDRTNWTIVP